MRAGEGLQEADDARPDRRSDDAEQHGHDQVEHDRQLELEARPAGEAGAHQDLPLTTDVEQSDAEAQRDAEARRDQGAREAQRLGEGLETRRERRLRAVVDGSAEQTREEVADDVADRREGGAGALKK
nr:hypothetical protein [Microbacterium sp. NIBRBAC000506063]